MPLTRRAVLASTAALATPAFAAPRYADAAAYSAARKGVSLLVMQGGRTIYEDYPRVGGREIGWELASGTKSFSGIIAAAASADGLLSLDERCAETLAEWRGDERRAITIRQLLTLTSGLETAVARPPPYAAAVTDARLTAQPGAAFAYGAGPFQIFGEIMRRKLERTGKPVTPSAYLQSRVLDGIGIAPTRWRTGRDGLPLMPQGALFSAISWARFGSFVLDGGPGLDRDVMRALFEPSRANPGYGLTWWLLRPGLIGPGRNAGLHESVGAAFPGEDIVMAAGAGFQRLYLLRRRDLVVVRQADDIIATVMGRGGPEWRDEDFLRLLLS